MNVRSLTDRQTDRQTDYDYRIAFLKGLLSFYVVLCHYWVPSGSPQSLILNRQRSVAVPVFIIISFCLMNKMFIYVDVIKFKKRLKRLGFPYISWGIIYYIAYSFIYFLLNIERPFDFYDFLWQITLGSDRYLCPQLWYQFDLIVITVCFFAICKFYKESKNKILIFVTLILVASQYIGFNFSLFHNFKYEMRYSLGRLAECFPMAVIGYLITNFKLLEKTKKNQFFVGLLSLISLFVIGRMPVFTSVDGFGYGGIYKYAYAICLFFLCYSIPFDEMPVFIKKILKFVSKYSFGVFCIHFGVGFWFNNFLVHKECHYNTKFECVCIYLISLLMSWLISLIPLKNVKQLVE